VARDLRLALSPLINAVPAAFPHQLGAVGDQMLDELIAFQEDRLSPGFYCEAAKPRLSSRRNAHATIEFMPDRLDQANTHDIACAMTRHRYSAFTTVGQ
jgi:hypothetical protein